MPTPNENPNRPAFVVFKDVLRDSLNELNAEEFFALFHAISHYQDTGEIPDVDRTTKLVLRPYILQFERDAEKYQRTCERNRTNGAKAAARAGKGKKPSRGQSDPVGATGGQQDPNNPVGADTDTDTDKDNKEDISFDRFWNAYGKKVGTADCKKRWAKLSYTDRSQILAMLPRYIAATPEEKFRKNPATFLNQRVWEDEAYRFHVSAPNSASVVQLSPGVKVLVAQSFDEKGWVIYDDGSHRPPNDWDDYYEVQKGNLPMSALNKKVAV